MTARPVDSSGDILPVRSPGALLSGVPAAAAALSDHLRLFAGDWWESADRGNRAIGLISSSRLTERDLPALSGSLSAYLLSFPAVQSVSDVRVSRDGRRFHFSAAARIRDDSSGDASVPVTFSFP